MFSCLSSFSKVFLYFPLGTIMANLGNALVNMELESDSGKSSSFVGVENPYLIGIFYMVDPHICAHNTAYGSSRSRLSSMDNGSDPAVRETATCTASLVCAYFNLGISLSREIEC